MKAWTLFFVILFSNIYEQRHISTGYPIDNGLPQSSAKTIVINLCSFILMSTEIAKERMTTIINTPEIDVFSRIKENTLSTVAHNILDYTIKNTFDRIITRDIIKNNQKLIIITADTGTGISTEKINDYISLFNNPELENPNFKRKSLKPAYDHSSVKINFRSNRPTETIVETTLIKANFI